MERRSIQGLVIVIILFIGLLWFLYGPKYNQLIYFGVCASLGVIIFVILIITTIIIGNKNRDAFKEFVTKYSLKSGEKIDEALESAIKYILHRTDLTFENFYTRQLIKGQISFVDVSYVSGGHDRRNFYTERIIVFPSSLGGIHAFTIGKKIYGRSLYGLIKVIQGHHVIKTDDEAFDSSYLLFVTDENPEVEHYKGIASRVFPLLEQHLNAIEKLPVGGSVYSCMISFTNQFGIIRFNSEVKDVEPFYNLANDLLSL